MEVSRNHSSEVANMENVFSLRKRSFLSPVSTGFTSHIFAEVESSNQGEYRWVITCLPLPIAGAESRLNSSWALSESVADHCQRSICSLPSSHAFVTRSQKRSR